MFEKETKFLYDFSMNQIKQFGSYITFNELAGSNLHPAIVKYISAEIDYLIYEDRQRLLSSSNFDYSGEEINKYFVLMTREIKRTKKFSIDYIGNIILHAISFSLNYLAQPNWALVKLIYAKESHLKPAEVIQILKYVYFYSYIPDIIEKYIQKKNLLDVQKSEIESLLSKADQEIFANSSLKLVDTALCSIGEFANIGSFSKTKIPLLMFELYLKEKKLDEYWQKLESGLGSDIKQVYELTELQRVLSSPAASTPVKKENYLDRLINQDKPLGIFRNRKESKEEEDQFEADENIIQMIRENSDPEPNVPSVDIEEQKETSDHLSVSSEDSLLVNGNSDGDEHNLQESSPANEYADDNSSGSLLVDSVDKQNMAEALPESELQNDDLPNEGMFVEEFEMEMDPEDDFIFLEDEIERPLSDQEKETAIVDLINSEDNLLNNEDQLPDGDDSLLNDNDTPDDTMDKISEPDKTSGADEENLEQQTLEIDFQNELEAFFSADDSKAADTNETETFAGEKNDTADNLFVESLSAEDDSFNNSSDEDIVIRYLEEVESGLGSAEQLNRNVERNRKNKDLAEYFSQREIHKVINTVFNDNMKTFARTFDKLSECENMTEAEAVLNSVIVENFVSPGSKGVKIIKKNLQKYFNQV